MLCRTNFWLRKGIPVGAHNKIKVFWNKRVQAVHRAELTEDQRRKSGVGEHHYRLHSTTLESAADTLGGKSKWTKRNSTTPVSGSDGEEGEFKQKSTTTAAVCQENKKHGS